MHTRQLSGLGSGDLLLLYHTINPSLWLINFVPADGYCVLHGTWYSLKSGFIYQHFVCNVDRIGQQLRLGYGQKQGTKTQTWHQWNAQRQPGCPHRPGQVLCKSRWVVQPDQWHSYCVQNQNKTKTGISQFIKSFRVGRKKAFKQQHFVVCLNVF